MQRILQPGEIEALDRLEFPRVRLPQPRELFAARALRLRQLAPDHPIGEYLRFAAALADAQSEAASTIATAERDPASLARALEHGLPVWPADGEWDAAWRPVLRALVARIVSGPAMPAPLSAAAARLAALDDAGLDTLARAALEGDPGPEEIAIRPLLMAALQVVFADRASRLDERAFGVVDPPTLCPVCGSAPVASVLRIGGAAGGHRYLHCGLCAAEWHMVRVKCSHCESTAGIRYQGLEGQGEVVLAETCDHCRTYRKLVNQEKDPLADPLVDDLASLMLDLLMAETAFSRASENPWLAFGRGGEEPRP